MSSQGNHVGTAFCSVIHNRSSPLEHDCFSLPVVLPSWVLTVIGLREIFAWDLGLLCISMNVRCCMCTRKVCLHSVGLPHLTHRGGQTLDRSFALGSFRPALQQVQHVDDHDTANREPVTDGTILEFPGGFLGRANALGTDKLTKPTSKPADGRGFKDQPGSDFAASLGGHKFICQHRFTPLYSHP